MQSNKLLKISAVRGTVGNAGPGSVSACRTRGKDAWVQVGSLSRDLQCCSGKGSLLRAAPPAQSKVCPWAKLGQVAQLTILPLEHSRGWSLCSQGRATRTFSASLLSWVLGCTLPLKPDPILQSSCILLSFMSVPGLFHLPGSTLTLHFASFYYFPLMSIL